MSLTRTDLVIVAAYLMSALGLGCYFSRSNRDTEAFFLGSRSMPGWALGLSLLSTSISSNTFLALPAYTYAEDFSLLPKDAVLPVAAALAISTFAPFFRQEGRIGTSWRARYQITEETGEATRSDIVCNGAVACPPTVQWTSAFEFLGERFGHGRHICRQYAAACYLFVQLVRVSSILYLISIPVAIISGLPGNASIAATAVMVALYSTLGGVRGVVYTDCIQSAVLLGSGIGVLVLIAQGLPNGLNTMWVDGVQEGKFNLLARPPNATDATPPTFLSRSVFSVVSTGLIQYLTTYTAAQDTIQRYMAASSLWEARKAIAICALLSIPTWAFFDMIGVALWSFYRHNTDPAVADLPADAVFPHFIVTQLPPGMAGVVVSGAMAAAMSSLDSSLNAIASVVVSDFVKPHVIERQKREGPPSPTSLIQREQLYLRVGRFSTVATTLFMIVVAILFKNAPKKAMSDLFNSATSVATGAAFGLFLVATIVPPHVCDAHTTVFAIGVSLVVNVFLALNSVALVPTSMTIEIDTYWTSVIVNLSFVVTTLLAGFCQGMWHRAVHMRGGDSRHGRFELIGREDEHRLSSSAGDHAIRAELSVEMGGKGAQTVDRSAPRCDP